MKKILAIVAVSLIAFGVAVIANAGGKHATTQLLYMHGAADQ